MAGNIIFGAERLVREKKPLVQCITNDVTVNDCANIVLAAGASPIMADEQREAADVARIADSLEINLGKSSESATAATLISAKIATERGIPIVLDPVGVGCIKRRLNFAVYLLSAYKISAVRGNMSEIKSLCGISGSEKGVDAGDSDTVTEGNASEAAEIPVKLARKYGCTVAATGKTDIVTDGKTVYILENGDDMMSMVTGTGCMSSALMGAYCGAGGNIFEACLSSTAVMGVCGELAAKYAKNHGKGTGTFKTDLFDGLSTLTENIFENTLKAKDITKYILTEEK